MSKEIILPVVIATAIGTTCLGSFLIYRLLKSKKKISYADKSTKISLRLVDKEHVTHDTVRFKFALPSAEHILGIPIGSHIYLSQKIDGSLIVRSYSPVTDNDLIGYVDLVIKIYRRDGSFSGGKMTTYLDSMSIGDSIESYGPSGRFEYKGNGRIFIKSDNNSPDVNKVVKRIGMVAGGSGITPIFQLIQNILKNSSTDKTQINLLYSNKSEKNIILRDEIDAFHDNHSQQFSRHYTINTIETQYWDFSVGYINSEMMIKCMPSPADFQNDLILVCGPPSMVETAVLPGLETIGYPKESIFLF